MKRVHHTILLFLILTGTLSASAEVLSQYTVRTANGYVGGTKERTVFKNKPYFAFRGIPFAKPPIGNLRFE
ncbi:hypothetical protein Trydic_g20374, partial [Trypoxylus dichotomus]